MARGGQLERTAVGDQHVHAAMAELGAVLGGEQSGHIISADHSMSGDGVLTALQLAAFLLQEDSRIGWIKASARSRSVCAMCVCRIATAALGAMRCPTTAIAAAEATG